MAYLIRSIIKFTFNKKIFTALILVIVIFSAVFTAFTVRLGTAFAYDGTKEGDHYKLDRNTANEITDVFINAVKESGATLIVATHDTVITERFDKVVKLENGNISE